MFDADQATPVTAAVCGRFVTACVVRSKIFAVPSEDPLTIRVPAGLKARSFTGPVWIVYVRSSAHVGTCHTSTEYCVRLPSSSWPTARRVLAGFQATERTRP